MFFKSFRQLPRITQDGLVEYSLQVPRSALSFANKGGSASNGGGPPQRGRSESPPPFHHHSQSKKYGADIDWILAGKPIFKYSLACCIFRIGSHFFTKFGIVSGMVAWSHDILSGPD